MWAAATALGQGIGPLVGGALTDAIDWRAIFAFDVLLLTAGIFACVLLARTHSVPEDASKHTGIDYLGAALLMVALASLTLAMSRGQSQGWASAEIISLLAVAAAASAGLSRASGTQKSPCSNCVFSASPAMLPLQRAHLLPVLVCSV